MKKTLKLLLILTVAMTFCFTVVLVVGAAPPEKAADVLPPGGQTIGGPAQFSFSLSQSIYFTSGFVPYPNVCVTVVNRGDTIDVRLESTVVNTICTLDPGETSTCCAESVGGVSLSCIDTGGCSARGFYRLDLRN